MNKIESVFAGGRAAWCGARVGVHLSQRCDVQFRPQIVQTEDGVVAVLVWI